MSKSLPTGLTDCLLWSEELGFGFHTRPPIDYEGDYFDNYVSLDATEIGAALTKARVEMVKRHWHGSLIDIGIGGGRFVKEAKVSGFDVSIKALAWLEEKGLLANPYNGCDAISCWDSLEHILDIESLIKNVKKYVFVSMPIYQSMEHCLASKHYKPGEHVWYFKRQGLIDWFSKQGFILMEENEIESDLGREDIFSFAFKRVV